MHAAGDDAAGPPRDAWTAHQTRAQPDETEGGEEADEYEKEGLLVMSDQLVVPEPRGN
jgi:hypothetical protein